MQHPASTDLQHTNPRFTKVCALAKGGMGRIDIVLRATGGFERLYVAKRIHDEFLGDPGFRGMFLDEARIAGLIRHVNVVSVLDVGEDEEGPYLLMDYVEGVSLEEALSFHRKVGEAMPLQVALRIVQQVASGLHAAHETRNREQVLLGIVHRDVSPSNIILGIDGIARVTDFGVAKALGRNTKTVTGGLKGKFSYMAPEVLRFRQPDRRADLFALGVVLYEMLANARAYPGDEGPLRILEEPPPDIGLVREDVPIDIVELIMDLLAKDASLRPETAREIVDRLEPVIAEFSVQEGTRTVEQYVVQTFGSLIAARRMEIERQRIAGDATVVEERSTPGSDAPTSALTPVPELSETRKGHARSDARLLGLAVVVPLLMALTAYALSTDDTPSLTGAGQRVPVLRPSENALEVPDPSAREASQTVSLEPTRNQDDTVREDPVGGESESRATRAPSEADPRRRNRSRRSSSDVETPSHEGSNSVQAAPTSMTPAMGIDENGNPTIPGEY